MNADTFRQCPKCMKTKPVSEFRMEYKRYTHQIKCKQCNKDMDGRLVLLIEVDGQYQLVGPNGCKKKYFNSAKEAEDFLSARWTNYTIRTFKYEGSKKP